MQKYFDKQNKTSCSSHSIVILFIPFIFLLGLILSYLGIFSLNVETHTLAIVAFIFFIFMLFVPHNANYAICYMRSSFVQMEEELQTALKQNALTIMGKTKSTLPIRGFILEYYKELRNDNFAKVAPSIFPMLGILGTFIAIALSMPDFTVKDIGALDKEISVLLSGIGTAFYASIYGILLSLIWTYFEKRGMAKADRQILELEKLYGIRVWKESELIKHQHMQSEFKDQQIVDTLKEAFNIDFVKELNEQYIKNFSTIINDTTVNFTKVTVHLQEVASELKDVLEEIEYKKESVKASALIEKNIENFNKSADKLNISLEKFDGSVEHTFEKIDEELGDTIEKLGRFGRVILDQNQLILKGLDSIKEDKEKE